MNLMATAFVPTPKASDARPPTTSSKVSSTASQPQALFFAPKSKAPTTVSGLQKSEFVSPLQGAAASLHSVGAGKDNQAKGSSGKDTSEPGSSGSKPGGTKAA
mmetsp:Transcript_3913/g.4936  ORF Transcript_3913/g.4936 Transcript_3913/m.4936 type:complete len:103 (+) Transcript_3913:1015-1323(+)|eukprot:CAMPEP_0185585268 /NCGR_PEP_ID=MMETSP0434-20130131/37736_1 /TAXON_ID=626734 ORGANISM="Favella taraikaensis, Strain Fe Narragansett Bay" /NCGR_SAMPLE_ID=MMETSP0434 /ASSEMBLY_ACC=CAM_ASM_000379 /LENGTH=102 /DNA_ID=CAMNT_0028205503 /DNA_START=1871 /DNA_END=2179 /DNA_ORIENTATION=-